MKSIPTIVTLIAFFIVVRLDMVAQNIQNIIPLKGQEVGDILYDPKLDNSNFCICNPADVFQSSAEDLVVTHRFKDGIRQKIQGLKARNKFSGYITIRFLVNCRGEADRFRVLTVDESFCSSFCDPEFTNAILNLLKQLSWRPLKFEGVGIDYYQILNFKVVDSCVVDIMP